MANTEKKATEHRIFPEMITITNSQDLPEGNSDLIKIDGISNNQIIVPLTYSVESAESIKLQLHLDNTAVMHEIPSDILGGISNDIAPHAAHEIGYGFENFTWKINNGQGAVHHNHRARLKYLIDARTTARRIVELVSNLGSYNINPAEDPTPIAEEIRSQNKKVLSHRDIQAISILWQERKINVLERILNGSNVPPVWEDFLKIHEVTGTEQDGIKKNLTDEYSNTSIIDYDVPEGRVATLEGLSSDVGAKNTLSEKTVSISRDNDKDYITYDPACMAASQSIETWHIHAFENINVRIKDTAQTNNFKAWAGITIRKPGAAFKAKMEEFSPGVLSSSLEPSEAEERLIESLRLRELARVGIVAIG